MTTEDFIIELFCRVDAEMPELSQHAQAGLWPSELVTIGMLFALKGVGERAFYGWLTRDYRKWFPRLPERTRLFRLLKTHRAWTERFLAAPSLLGVADSYGVELLHPRREGRSPMQLGAKGTSNLRWIVGAKVAVVLNHLGLVCAWDCNLASVSDQAFQPLIARFAEQMVVCVDPAFHRRSGDVANVKVCPRRTWNSRMLMETVWSMLTTVCHLKKVAHRQADYFRARLAYLLAAFNLLVQWHGFQPDANGMVHLSIAEFSL